MKNNIIGDAYLQSIKNITNIHFDKTISVFQDLNSLIIIFFEKDNTNGLITNMNNSTRRIYINHFKNNINKKTKRNLFKDIT